MKTTNLGNVAVQNAGVTKNKFPKSRNVYSSAGFGELQIVQMRSVDPDTTSTFSIEDLTYVEPVVAPTYGHVKQKYWHYFVKKSDVWPDFQKMMGETKTRRTNGLYIPKSGPWMEQCMMSCLLLFGCHCTIYKYQYRNDSTGMWKKHYYTPVVTDDAASISAAQAFYVAMRNALNAKKPAYTNSAWRYYTSMNNDYTFANPSTFFGIPTFWIDARLVANLTDRAGYRYENANMKIPLSNTSLYSLFDNRLSKDYYNIDNGLDETPCTPDESGCDYMVEFNTGLGDGVNTKNEGYAFCFRANAFSNRMAKILYGMEFQPDFRSQKKLSVLPLLAAFVAYYECFGLLYYNNFESTACAHLINEFTEYSNSEHMQDWDYGFFSNGDIDMTGKTYIDSVTWSSFVKDLGSFWVTDSQDVVSAITRENGLNRNDYTWLLERLINVGTDVGPDIPTSLHLEIPDVATKQSVDESNVRTNAHGYINNPIHGQLDAEIMKRWYQRINVNTIAGQNLKQLLITQGYGDFVAHCQPQFIGYDEIDIDFSQVQSKADTLSETGKRGMILGERGGVGEGYGYSKQHKFTNQEHGYIITFCAIEPDAGYTNQLNVMFDEIQKYDHFTPDFDGVGQELIEVNKVVGNMPVAFIGQDEEYSHTITSNSFGFAPFMTKFKFVHNIVNGLFAKRSTRANYTPYMMDKQIYLGDCAVTQDLSSDSLLDYIVEQYFPISAFPLSGLSWRYPTRYAFLGLYTRIFANLGDSVDDVKKFKLPNLQAYEYLNSENDGFVLMQTIRGFTWEHKLPITDSYETLEDGNKGRIDTNIAKA